MFGGDPPLPANGQDCSACDASYVERIAARDAAEADEMRKLEQGWARLGNAAPNAGSDILPPKGEGNWGKFNAARRAGLPPPKNTWGNFNARRRAQKNAAGP